MRVFSGFLLAMLVISPSANAQTRIRSRWQMSSPKRSQRTRKLRRRSEVRGGAAAAGAGAQPARSDGIGRLQRERQPVARCRSGHRADREHRRDGQPGTSLSRQARPARGRRRRARRTPSSRRSRPRGSASTSRVKQAYYRLAYTYAVGRVLTRTASCSTRAEGQREPLRGRPGGAAGRHQGADAAEHPRAAARADAPGAGDARRGAECAAATGPRGRRSADPTTSADAVRLVARVARPLATDHAPMLRRDQIMVDARRWPSRRRARTTSRTSRCPAATTTWARCRRCTSSAST